MKDFIRNPLPPQIGPGLVRKLLAAEAATCGHFLHSHFMAGEIQAMGPEARIAGTAVTLRLAANDSALLHDVISDLRPGDVLIVDRSGDTRHACWGGGVTHAAVLTGMAGAVVDGPLTDLGEIRRLGLPIWARGRSALTTKLYAQSGAFNIPVSCGGVIVHPGDAVIADESGVVVLPPDIAEAAADRAIAMQAAEQTLIARLRAGERMGDISGASAMIAERL